MRSNTEFRNLAWKRLWAEHWFGRLFGGGLLLSLCGYAANTVIGGVLNRLGVQTWQDYYLARVQNLRDLTTPVPNLTNDFVFQATSSGVLSMFIGYIMAGIAAYGTAAILLKCLKNEENGWLGAAFGGFRDPFGMLWLMIRYILIFFGWGLLAGVPVGLCVTVLVKAGLMTSPVACGCLTTFCLCYALLILSIPFYRYRFLFLVKAEHPDWSAGVCIRSCKALMEGHKMESFRLDCAYWKPITLALLLSILMCCGAALIASGGIFAVLGGSVLLVSFVGLIIAVIILSQYISVGQGFLYEDLKNNPTTE